MITGTNFGNESIAVPGDDIKPDNWKGPGRLAVVIATVALKNQNRVSTAKVRALSGTIFHGFQLYAWGGSWSPLGNSWVIQGSNLPTHREDYEMKHIITVLALLCLTSPTLSAETFSADVWADNWFEMRVDGKKVAEDSVPITTERSFNAESFEFVAHRPFIIGLVAKDFKQNDTGLEYIGTRRQQMGDGGLILQVKDSSGVPVAVSNGEWQCLVIHSAPLDKSCERETYPVAGRGTCTFQVKAEPEGWDLSDFDASDWPKASVYTEREVSPKDGYDRINWADDARLIWGPDLEQSNTILCRLVVE